MVRKFLSLILVLLLLLSLFGCSEKKPENGTAEGDYVYTENEDGTVTISAYTGSDKNVVVPATLGGKPVSAFGKNAFNEIQTMETLVIPAGVKTLGMLSVNTCNSLVSVTIPDSVTTIEKSTFFQCEALKEIVIPDSVTTLGDLSLSCCTALEKVTLPKNITVIGQGLFAMDTNLKEVVIPDGVTAIKPEAFWLCSEMLRITVPASVTSIEGWQADDCPKLEAVYVAHGSYAEEWLAENGMEAVIRYIGEN